MRAASRVAFVTWFVVSAGGCAAVTGLDSISEQDCAPNCGDAQSKDVTVDVPTGDSTGPDTSSGSDTGSMDTSTADTSSPEDAHEASTKEAGTDAPVDSPAEVAADAPEGSSPDAPFDSGCGDLNTVTNCSACGDKCASVTTVETSSTCNGDTNGFAATCSYTCASGYQDCNAANVPNLDGCECHVAGATQAQCCLGTASCPITHNNGLNQASSRFFDCDTYAANPSQVADDACIAYVGAANAGQCQPYSDSDAAAPDSWCSGSFTGDCICWTFSGQYAGQVYDAKAQGAPTPSDCYYGQSATLFN